MYDYIIVGAGTSGCVVANRITQYSSSNVLLLEAGGLDDKPDIHIPGAYQKLLGTEIDWNYVTESEPFLSNRRIPIARGKVLGGCSSINAMVYVRGHSADYDGWERMGNEGWDSHSLAPFFEKLENDPAGSITLTTPVTPHPLSQHFVTATHGQAVLYQTTITQGKRCSSADAFLHPLQHRRNFNVETQATVSKILFENNRAVGVTYQKNGVMHTVYARKEIILCAGALNSPALLMLSGVGPAQVLKKFGIPLVRDLPGVGENLQDHLWVMVTYQSLLPSPSPSSNACEAGWFIQSSYAEGSAPDLQIDTAFDLELDFLRDYRGPTFSICPILLHPKSRGRVLLQSADPFVPPKIHMNYLEEKDDILPLLEGISQARALATSAALNTFLGDELLPGKAVSSEADLREFIQREGTTLWHPIGTCRMGNDANAVVDSQLKVHGIVGLRVIDASIMPTLPSGNTQAVCFVIGEKGADLIQKELLNNNDNNVSKPVEKNSMTSFKENPLINSLKV